MSDIIWQPGITLEQLEKQVILISLKYYQGNKSQTAMALGIAIRTLDNKLEKYKKDDDELQGRSTREKKAWEDRSRALRGQRMESVADLPAQQPVPVRKREEVQKMPPVSRADDSKKA